MIAWFAFLSIICVGEGGSTLAFSPPHRYSAPPGALGIAETVSSTSTTRPATRRIFVKPRRRALPSCRSLRRSSGVDECAAFRSSSTGLRAERDDQDGTTSAAETASSPSPPTSSSSVSPSLYQDLPTKKAWTFGILTSGFPPQQLLVPFVKFITFQVWKLMMNELVTHDEKGRFIRESFEAGNNPAPLELPGSTASGTSRYRIYLGNPCPWCHRVKAVLAVLDLENDIPITMLIDDAEKASKGGWVLPKPRKDEEDGSSIAKELIYGDLADVYNYCYRDFLEEGEKYKGRCTAPLLVDVETGTIVSNESNDIMKLLNDYARRRGDDAIDLRPIERENELDEATKRWFNLLWNGAYRCGFSTSQVAYDEAADDVLRGLSEMDALLGTQNYLTGESLTEVDLKNFAWVTRHDYAYTVVFKSPGGRIAQYSNISEWVKRIVTEYPALLDTVDLADACGSYYRQLFMLNFGKIVPRMPTTREWVSGL